MTDDQMEAREQEELSEMKIEELERGGERCDNCGRGMELSSGWSPSFSDPDNSGLAPEAEPYCPVCTLEAEIRRLKHRTNCQDTNISLNGQELSRVRTKNAELKETISKQSDTILRLDNAIRCNDVDLDLYDETQRLTKLLKESQESEAKAWNVVRHGQ